MPQAGTEWSACRPARRPTRPHRPDWDNTVLGPRLSGRVPPLKYSPEPFPVSPRSSPLRRPSAHSTRHRTRQPISSKVVVLLGGCEEAELSAGGGDGHRRAQPAQHRSPTTRQTTLRQHQPRTGRRAAARPTPRCGRALRCAPLDRLSAGPSCGGRHRASSPPPAVGGAAAAAAALVTARTA
jgi:hypothetical protein